MKNSILIVMFIMGLVLTNGCASQNGTKEARINHFVNDHFYFEFDEYEVVLDEKNLNKLIYKVEYMRHFPDTRVLINGHTDERGTDKYNLDLSRHRAEEVKRLFLEADISPRRIYMINYGKRKPVVSGDEDDIRELNRRVEVSIVNN